MQANNNNVPRLSGLSKKLDDLHFKQQPPEGEEVRSVRKRASAVESTRARICVKCVGLKDAIINDTVKQALEALTTDLPKLPGKILWAQFEINNYAVLSETVPAVTEDHLIFTVDGKERRVKLSGAFTDDREIYPKKDYAIFADAVLHREHSKGFCSFAIADGCGLGEKSRNTAQFAVEHSLQNLNNLKGKNPRKIAALHVKALQSVQQVLTTTFKNIEAKKMDLRDVQKMQYLEGYKSELLDNIKKTDIYSSTTLTLATIAKGCLVTTGVGDCKVMLLREDEKGTRYIVDITASSRSSKVTDCGGSLVCNELLDWGNVSTAHVPLEAGDTIILMSDGVSDNFYPEFHGKKPSDFGKEGKWQDKGLTYFRHSEFMRTFEEAIAKKTSVKDIAEAIQAYIASKTHERKLYLFDHPEEQAPEDHLNYPGKPDHASCIIIQISKEKISRMKYRSADK